MPGDDDDLPPELHGLKKLADEIWPVPATTGPRVKPTIAMADRKPAAVFNTKMFRGGTPPPLSTAADEIELDMNHAAPVEMEDLGGSDRSGDDEEPVPQKKAAPKQKPAPKAAPKAAPKKKPAPKAAPKKKRARAAPNKKAAPKGKAGSDWTEVVTDVRPKRARRGSLGVAESM